MIVPGVEVDAAALAIPLEPLPADQVVAGTPSTGFVELTSSIGVWEHTPGTSTDVEVRRPANPPLRRTLTVKRAVDRIGS